MEATNTASVCNTTASVCGVTCEYYDSNGTRIPLSSSKHPLNDKIVHPELYDREKKDEVHYAGFYIKETGRLVPPSSPEYHMLLKKYGIDADTN